MSKLSSLNLTKKYGLKTVLNNVSIEIQKKEIVGLLALTEQARYHFFIFLLVLLRPILVRF